MSINPTLLTLPGELREQIWSMVFEDLNVKSIHNDRGFDAYATCEACCNDPRNHKPRPSTVQLYRDAFKPLLTNKQIYDEASPVFYSTLTLHHTSSHLPLLEMTPPSVRQKLTRFVFVIHVHEHNRINYHSVLERLPSIFPSMTQITVHTHMRSPVSHDHLLDAVYIGGPLAKLPVTIEQTLHFAYEMDEIMFHTPVLGDIRSSDAIEEHEAVIREFIDGEKEIVAAEVGAKAAINEPAMLLPGINSPMEHDAFHDMTIRLLMVARGHEQRWIENLERARLGGGAAQHQQGSDDDDEDNEDEDGYEDDIYVVS